MQFEEAVKIVSAVLKSQKLTIAEHEILQTAFGTILEAANHEHDAIPVQHPVQ